jgi:hypothetical protein
MCVFKRTINYWYLIDSLYGIVKHDNHAVNNEKFYFTTK